MTRPTVARLSVVLAVVCVCTLTVGAVVPATVGAGDSVTIFFLEPSEGNADAGETVTLEFVVSSHGNYVGEGIDQLSATIAYDPDVFSVADVDHGPMLAAGDSNATVDGTVEIDDEAGLATIDQERTPSGDGAKTTDTAATITLEVAEDASSTNETVELTDGSAMDISEYSQAVFERDATITIDGTDGGIDPVAGFAVPSALLAVGAVLLFAVRRLD
ncbi:cohesin domain-containing protein [Natronorubrum thiooxidans]|uniref:Cohesin domain-containing protein n=1 Tax=Natronorubrum thiooxidans TaxID=308853 RepID=A0A1N7E611_9EURY|nr:cohesin domain-containing protein [Natronorubrum thiooxidans]SIR83517.1 Cohesin domain-containing protein [Natronorubrum thiooxidans]